MHIRVILEKVLIFAGSREFSGAAAIVSEACVRAGAGLVTLMTYDNTFSGNISSSPESMILEIEHKNIENSFKKNRGYGYKFRL